MSLFMLPLMMLGLTFGTLLGDDPNGMAVVYAGIALVSLLTAVICQTLLDSRDRRRR